MFQRRGDRPRLMVGADLVNALALAAIPIMSAAGVLSVPMIYLVALLSATAYVFGNAAELDLLRIPCPSASPSLG